MKRLPLAIFALLLCLSTTARSQTSVRVIGGNVPSSGTVWVLIEMRSDLPINTVRGTLTYDPSRLIFVEADVGNAIAFLGEGANTNLDLPPNSPGQIGFSISLRNGNAIVSNAQIHILSIRFNVIPQLGEVAISFSDAVNNRQVVSNNGAVIPATWTPSSVNVIGQGVGHEVRYENTVFSIGQTGAVPVYLQAKGNENALSLTILYDPSKLAFLSVTPGPQFTSGTILSNHHGIARIGIAFALPIGQTFPVGRQHVFTLHFNAQPISEPVPTRLWFADSPVSRELVTTTADPLPLIFHAFDLLTLDSGKEADVSPRTTGNGQVTLADWVQIGRFAAGLDFVSVGYEFRKADCAPQSTDGDGRVTLADWVQAGRYAAALDPIRQARGPDRPAETILENRLTERFATRPESSLPESARRVLLSPIPSRSVGEALYSITLHGRGDENAVAFTLEYDAGELELLDAKPADERAAIHINRTESGRVGVVLALPPGQSLGAGEVLVLRFSNLRRGIVAQSLHFADGKVAGEVVTVEAESVPAVFGVEVGRVIRRRY